MNAIQQNTFNKNKNWEMGNLAYIINKAAVSTKKKVLPCGILLMVAFKYIN